MRPQVAELPARRVTTAAWMRTREDGRLRWWLVPLTWLVGHGSRDVAGRDRARLVAVAGLALDRARTRARARPACWCRCSRRCRRVLTPRRVRACTARCSASARARVLLRVAHPRFTRPRRGRALGLMLAVAVVLFVRRGRATWFDLALLLTAGACAVWSWRTVPVAAVMLVPLIAAHAYRRTPGGPRPTGRGRARADRRRHRGRPGRPRGCRAGDRRRTAGAAVLGRPGARLAADRYAGDERLGLRAAT